MKKIREEEGIVFNPKYIRFSDFAGSVVTQLRWCGSLYNRSIEKFLRNLIVKELWKSTFICRSYDQKTKWLFFWNTVTSCDASNLSCRQINAVSFRVVVELHDLGWWLVGKPVMVDFLFALTELSSLSVTVPELWGEMYTARLFSQRVDLFGHYCFTKWLNANCQRRVS